MFKKHFQEKALLTFEMKKRLEGMSRVNAEVIKNTRSAVVRRQFYFIAYNVSGLNDVFIYGLLN